MEGSLVFNSAAFRALELDEWAGQKDTATGAAEQHDDDHHHPQQHQQQAQHGRWKRSGVGAVTTAKPKEAAAQLEATGSLQKLVMGHRSKKKRDREAAEAEVAAAAAAAEAEEEDEGEALDDSKARMFATASSTIPLLANTGSAPSGEAPKKKKKKKKRKKKNNAQAGPTQEQEQAQEQKTEDADETGKAAVQAKKGQSSVPGNLKQTQQPQQSTHQAPQHHKPAQQQGPDGAAQQQGQQQGQQRPRKRTKTRSKQKNIRRDTRPVDQRPEHLRPGHVAFAGRGMTDETRKRLGFKEEGTDEAEM